MSAKVFNNKKIILLQAPTDKAGVSATFTKETNSHTSNSKLCIGTEKTTSPDFVSKTLTDL